MLVLPNSRQMKAGRHSGAVLLVHMSLYDQIGRSRREGKWQVSSYNCRYMRSHLLGVLKMLYIWMVGGHIWMEEKRERVGEDKG